MDFGKFSVQSQLPIAFAGRYGMYETSGVWNISFRLSGIKDGVSTSEKTGVFNFSWGERCCPSNLFDFTRFYLELLRIYLNSLEYYSFQFLFTQIYDGTSMLLSNSTRGIKRTL